MSSVEATVRPFQANLPHSLSWTEGIEFPHCSEEFIMAYLAVPGAPVIPTRVLESDSITSVKLRIHSCNGHIVKKQKLVFDGQVLARSGCLIQEYDSSDGNVLHLVIHISDLHVITIKSACGKKMKFHVEKGHIVHHVKQQVAMRDDGFVDFGSQRLVFEGEEFDDWRMIQDICKSNDAVVHLLVHRSAKISSQQIDNDLQLTIVSPASEENGSNEFQVFNMKPPNRDVSVEPIIINPKIELPQVIKDLVHATRTGLEMGNPPIMSTEGTGGTYLMQDVSGHEYVGVFKPIDEEPMAENNPRGLPVSTNGEGLKKGTKVGEGAIREVAAYILDHPVSGRRSFSLVDVGFSGVPPTAMVQCSLGPFNYPKGFDHAKTYLKLGSLQMFVKNNGSCEDMGPAAFPVHEVHKICVLDIRLANADRHSSNILVRKEGEEGCLTLVPIDHGYCLPETFEDCTFEWLYWPQSRQPFSSETVNYIKSLDAEQDISLLKFHGWEISLECSRILRITTMLLKKGVKKGLTAHDIGSILCRETIQQESRIEEIIHEAKDATLPGSSEATFMESISEIMDRFLDKLTV